MSMRKQLRAGLAGLAMPAFALLLAPGCAQPDAQPGVGGLGGTSWQLVKFQGGDDKVVVPDEKAKYTIAFAADGSVSVRFDCNRGHGSWKSASPGQIQFGPMALTRAMCPPGSMHDQLVKQWFYVRSYVIRNGRLHLSLMADGGIYEFEPI